MLFIKVQCALHWGWRLNIVPFSKSRPPLMVPPPTTLIGALAYPLCRTLKLPESYGEYSSAERLRGVLSYVGLRLDAPIIDYFDLMKITFFYRGKAKSDAVAVGKTYTLVGPCGGPPTVTLCYVVNEKKFERTFNERFDKLVEAACGITRIGSRESVVAPLNVKHGEAKPLLHCTRGETIYSLTRKAGRIVGTCLTQEVVDWEGVKIGDYRGAPRDVLIIPYEERTRRPRPVSVDLSPDYALVDVDDGDLVVVRRASLLAS